MTCIRVRPVDPQNVSTTRPSNHGLRQPIAVLFTALVTQIPGVAVSGSYPNRLRGFAWKDGPSASVGGQVYYNEKAKRPGAWMIDRREAL